MSFSVIMFLLILACALVLVLIVMALKRINEEGLTVSDDAKRQHFKRSIEEVQRQQREEHAVASVSDETSSRKLAYSRFGFGRVLEMSFDEAVERVSAALRVEEFQLLNDTDVIATLHRKDMPGCRMLVLYHAEMASRVFDIEPSLGLLTVTVTVRQDLSDDVRVEISDPSLHSALASHPDLHEVVANLKVKLLSVLQAI